jgi:glycerol-3-phosphate dehydrogenase
MAEITPSTIKRDFDAVASETFDLIVVKRGIIAAAITRDDSLRGFRTLLLDKDDFASAKTTCSSRLINGG